MFQTRAHFKYSIYKLCGAARFHWRGKQHASQYLLGHVVQTLTVFISQHDLKSDRFSYKDLSNDSSKKIFKMIKWKSTTFFWTKYKLRNSVFLVNEIAKMELTNEEKSNGIDKKSNRIGEK